MIEVRRPVTWYHDLCSCLHSTVGGVLGAYGYAPVVALGAAWRFERPRHWAPVEFAWPDRDGDLHDTLAPHEDVSLRWHEPEDADAAEEALLSRLSRGLPVVAAVDNFHLPFRPAWHDVHAGHLIVVFGYDSKTDSYLVHDAVPPRYSGWLAGTHLRRSRGSTNPDETDPFFAGLPLGHRWLEVTPGASPSSVGADQLARILRDNVAHFLDGAGTRSGLEAAREYLIELVEGAGRVEVDVLREAYGFGWIPQASAALHADFLSHVGATLHRWDLVEAARAVERVAHAWTPVRVGAAHGIDAPVATAAHLRAAGHSLLRSYDAALESVGTVLDAMQAA